jgi:hypothetical protein
MAKSFEDLSGKRFGSLTVVTRLPNIGRRRVVYSCVCDCGEHRVVMAQNLRNGRSISCGGCIVASSARGKSNLKHGMSRTPEYQAWASMKDRCYNSRNKFFSYYGGRGIKVCQRWLGQDGFINFIEDMGLRPSNNNSLDRKDNDGDYTPDNCRWGTKSEQAGNRRYLGRCTHG